jgi:hypothetical protein
MRFRNKIGPLHHPILKPANLPDFLTVARSRCFGFVQTYDGVRQERSTVRGIRRACDH